MLFVCVFLDWLTVCGLVVMGYALYGLGLLYLLVVSCCFVGRCGLVVWLVGLFCFCWFYVGFVCKYCYIVDCLGCLFVGVMVRVVCCLVWWFMGGLGFGLDLIDYFCLWVCLDVVWGMF